MSDFEQSYAANVAPRYPTQKGKSTASRFLGAISSAAESKVPSRQTSPDKHNGDRGDDAGATIRPRRGSSPLGSKIVGAVKAGKAKVSSRMPSTKEKSAPTRSVTNPGNKSTFRRQPGVQGGSKVGYLAKQYEKINRENEKAQRRYSVIRGRRARPVTNARAKVQVLESVKDAINDEESDDDGSSEADDEGEEDDENRKKSPQELQQVSTQSPSGTDDNASVPPVEPSQNPSDAQALADPPASAPSIVFEPVAPEVPIYVPPSPLLASIPRLRQPPPDLDISAATERHSILRALSGFWAQPPIQSRGRVELDGDDPMADPEHIFRDSSMVVRTDEPTSIIALALKYATFLHVAFNIS